MNAIEDYSLTTEELARFLDVTPQAFRNWQKRYGLLKNCTSGRGVPAYFRFADSIAAIVAKKLMSVGSSADQVCQYVNTFRPGLHEFVLRNDVKIAFANGKISYSADLHRDVFLTFSLEGAGWDLAEYIAGLIEKQMGKSMADLARTEFRAAVDEARAR